MIKKYESSFSVNVVGEDTGESFVGKFTVRTRLSHGEKLEQDIIRRNLLGAQPNGAAAGERASNTSEILSQLSVRIVEAPSWWVNSGNGRELYDDNVLVDVFTAAVKCEADARAELKKSAEEAKAELKKEIPAE